jgi:hypothetical protein
MIRFLYPLNNIICSNIRTETFASLPRRVSFSSLFMMLFLLLLLLLAEMWSNVTASYTERVVKDTAALQSSQEDCLLDSG